jgi:hypothetical protein
VIERGHKGSVAQRKTGHQQFVIADRRSETSLSGSGLSLMMFQIGDRRLQIADLGNSPINAAHTGVRL